MALNVLEVSSPILPQESPNERSAYTLETDIPAEAIQQLRSVVPIKELVLTKIPLVTVKLAQRLAGLHVERLWLRSDVTRRAMRHIIQIPGLQELNASRMTGTGPLANFGKAECLTSFRSDYCMTEHDLMQVTQCASLCELGAQNAELSSSAMAAIASLPHLAALDVEATRFDNKMAKQISCSRTIASLDLGATRMSRAGLECLIRMQQLHSLDLWALDLNETDLGLLLDLPKLEYLSLGNHDHLPSLDPHAVTKLLLECRSLKRVWLDGVPLQAGQREALEAKLDYLHLT